MLLSFLSLAHPNNWRPPPSNTPPPQCPPCDTISPLTSQVPSVVQIPRRSFLSHTRLVFSLNAGPGLRTRLIFWMRGAPSSIWFASINIWIIHHKHSSSPAKRPSSSSNWVQLRLESYDSEWFLLWRPHVGDELLALILCMKAPAKDNFKEKERSDLNCNRYCLSIIF